MNWSVIPDFLKNPMFGNHINNCKY